MKREKNFKTAKFTEALEYIDVRFIEEAGKKIKERPAGQTVAGMSRAKSLRQVLALVACVLLLSAVIPAVSYLMGHLPDILGSSTGDDTTEQTAPETPPEETTSPAPETSVNTDHETTAPLYDGTTAEPEIEYDGSRGLIYKMWEDSKSYYLVGMGTCTDENIVVASTYDGFPVTMIGESALSGYDRVKSVTIPNSVSVIDHYAFMNCTALESVTIPDKVNYIGAEAFSGTAIKNIKLPSNLTMLSVAVFKDCPIEEVVIPYSVEVINSAFWGCSELKSVTIGRNVAEIKALAFYGCSKLTDLYFDGTVEIWNLIKKHEDWNAESVISVVHCSNGDVKIEPHQTPEPEYDGSRGLEYKVNEDGKTASLIGLGSCKDKDVVVASSYNGCPVTDIRFDAFAGSWITSVTLSDSVIRVDYSVFMNCNKNIKQIHISKSVLEFGHDAFSFLQSLEKITVSPENPRYYVTGNCLIDRETKEVLRGWGEFTIPDDGSVTSIAEGAFSCCNIVNVVVPKGITEIDSTAFAFCASLKRISLPEGLLTIGEGSFDSCTSLESITFPDSLTKIDSGAFAYCENLLSVKIGRRIERIEKEVFYYSAVRDIEYAGTMSEWKSIKKPDNWNYNCFATVIHCSDGDVDLIEYDGSRGLEYRIEGDHAVLVGIGTCTDTDIVIASTYNGVPVTEIGERAFADCFSIVTVTVPEGVKIIGNDAFNFCRSLIKVTLPTTIEAIGDRAFFECVRVEEFKGSENIITIGANAFDTCNSITSIKLGNKLQKIGSEAFKSCMSLKEITVPASVTSLGDGVFAGCSSLMKAVILPKTDILGKSFFSSCGLLREVTLPEGLKEISRDAFHACASLSEIDIPESVSTIGEAAFAYCHSLQTVTLPTRLTSLGMSVFQGSGIVEIVIPSGVGEIPGSAFGECISLTKIVIPEGVTRIQNEAFYRCSKLTSISIPSSVTGIGSEAFSKSALTEIVIPDNVTWIWEAAFRECKNLSSVKLGKKLELIMEAAFADCIRLESVRIPASVKEISNGAFVGCSSLKSVTIERGIERFGTGIFVQCHDLTEIVFTGTVAEWRKIEIPEKAFGHTQNEIIRCSDGDFFTHSDIPAAYRDILFGDAKFVFDSKEIRLDEFRFPSGGALITLCADVKYAVVDMDRDGLPEVVITGDVGDMLVLHEKGGKVYGFDFTFRNMDRIKTDGSFEWNDTTAEGLCYGDSRLSFPKGKCTVTDICSVVGDGSDSVKYFVGGAETTRDSYLRTADTVSKTEVEWYPLDRYPVAS